MAESPRAIFGRVHCATVIRFSEKEEKRMAEEYQRPLHFRPIRRPEKSPWRVGW